MKQWLNTSFIYLQDPGIGNNDTILDEVSVSNSPGYKDQIYKAGESLNVYVRDRDDNFLMAKVREK